LKKIASTIKIINFIVKNKITHFGEIYRLISFNHFIHKTKIDFSNQNILDVGFNKGRYRWFFNEVVNTKNYIGVEIDKKFLNVYPNTFFHNFEKIKLNKKFNLIFCSHILEHVENDSNFLSNIKESLDNNGHLIIRVPIPSSNRIYLRKYNSKLNNHPEHFRDGYKPKEIRKLLSKAGLKVADIYISMGKIGLFVHTIFEYFRDNQLRYQRVFQLPYIILSIIDIYLSNNENGSDLLIIAQN